MYARKMKLSGKDRALLMSHKLHRGLYARVAKRLGVDRSYVDRVASGSRKSDTIMRVLLAELRRIQPRNVR
jgi:transcriptional regulator with XRE-family HTH domain